MTGFSTGIRQPVPSHIQPIHIDNVADEASLDVLLAEDTLANEKVIVTILEAEGIGCRSLIMDKKRSSCA